MSWFDAKVIPTEAALAATALLIGGAMAFSVLRTRGLSPEAREAEHAKAATWWVPGSPVKREGRPPEGT